jgi:hypothetical protein
MTSQNSIIPAQPEPMSIAVQKLPNPQTVELIANMSKVVGMSSVFNSDAKNPEQRVADAFFVMMLGVEIGLPPITSLRMIHLIKGTPATSGAGMLSILRRAGVEVEIPDAGKVTTSATVRLRRPGVSDWYESTFTVDMAKAAGLGGRDMWTKFPANMLIWRALSNAARFYCPDIINGLYTKEEIADAQFDADGEIVDIDIDIKPAHWSESEKNLTDFLYAVRHYIPGYDDMALEQRSAAALKLASATTWKAFDTGRDAGAAVQAGADASKPTGYVPPKAPKAGYNRDAVIACIMEFIADPNDAVATLEEMRKAGAINDGMTTEAVNAEVRRKFGPPMSEEEVQAAFEDLGKTG